MIEKITITNKVLVKGKIEERKIELNMPCDNKAIKNALRSVGAYNTLENGYFDVKISPNCKIDISGAIEFEQPLNRIYKVAYLSAQVAALNSADLAKFYILCDLYVTDWPTDGLPHLNESLTSFINMLHNISNKMIVVENINSYEELGEYCFVNKLVPELNNCSPKVTQFIDFKKVGEEYRHYVNGAFCNGHFIYRIPKYDELVLPYDSKSLLAEDYIKQSKERNIETIKFIAVIGNEHVRDVQYFSGNPKKVNENESFSDIKCPSLFLGIFEGNTPDEARKKAADDFGCDPGIISLYNFELETGLS